MSFSDILKPRPEVLRRGGIEGVIDIENIRDRKRRTIENLPETFFELTYPTSDIRSALNHLHHRFNTKESSAGLYLLEGYKGSGKSHIELLVYHLFTHPQAAQQWLQKHRMVCDLPSDAIVVIHKFTDFPLDSIWELVFARLGVTGSIRQDCPPNLDEFHQALGGRRLVLIFDELERGIKSISNESYREQNLAFLQMLSEESSRTENASVTLFASVYDARQEPGATLKRVPRIDIKFSDPTDRQRIVLHRLFSNYLEVDKRNIEPVIRSYANFWKRHEITFDEKYIDRFFDSFPFSPELLEMILFRVQASGGFQGPRGALGLLGAVVRHTHETADIVTMAHLDLENRSIQNRLSDLDPSQKILQCALNDLRDLRDAPLCREIIASVLAASLSSGPHTRGIDEQALARQVLNPGEDINRYLGTLQALVKLGTYFQYQEGNYFFDEHEKPYAKVEYRSLRIDPSRALDYVFEVWKKQLFQDAKAVVFREIDQAKSELSLRGANDLRFVFAPKRLSETERAAIYHGAENRNQIILLEPKNDTFNALENPDIIKWAQRAIAASELQATASDAERRRQYERIGREDTKLIIDAFKRAGLVFVWMQPDSTTASGLFGEIESLGSAFSRDEVLRQLKENLFPRQRFEEHILEHLSHLLGRTVGEVDAAYKKTLGFPVRVAVTTILDPIKNLCRQRQIGLRHERDSACGRYPDLTADEIRQARLVEPFEDAKTQPNLAHPVYREPDQGQVEGRGKDEIGWDETAPEIAVEAPPQQIETIRTPFMKSLAELRQEIAQKLNDFAPGDTEPTGDVKIRSAQFFIFSELDNVDLSTLPSSLRGTLSGAGAITIDIGIKKSGEFSKAQIEQMVETLPIFQEAQYRLELKIERQD